MPMVLSRPGTSAQLNVEHVAILFDQSPLEHLVEPLVTGIGELPVELLIAVSAGLDELGEALVAKEISLLEASVCGDFAESEVVWDTAKFMWAARAWFSEALIRSEPVRLVEIPEETFADGCNEQRNKDERKG